MKIEIRGGHQDMTLTLVNGVDGERLSPDQVVNMISGLGRDDLDVKVNMIGRFANNIARGLSARGVKYYHHMMKDWEKGEEGETA